MAKKTVTKKQVEKCMEEKSMKWNCCKGGMGGAYFLGMIGSAVYFISNSVGFWAGVVGFLKALVWPAFVVYGLLNFLGL